MLKAQLIGCGAAGNKAVINHASQSNYQEDFLLINSTNKDIPPEYWPSSMIFGQESGYFGGCGKERELGKTLFLQDQVNGVRGLDRFVDPETNFVIVCGSTEGGSGSATIPIVAKYIKQVLHKPVIAVLFFGFNDDARGMQNSIEICQELPEDIGVISICNSKFAKLGRKVAEHLANTEYSHIVNILCGRTIRDSNQNIDDTDLYKVVTTPGYMTVEDLSMNVSCRTMEQFDNQMAAELSDSCAMMAPEPSAKRIAVIFALKSESASYADLSCKFIKERYGSPYELFTHVQKSEDESVEIIAAGQSMPIDEVKEIFENYKKTTDSINKNRDGFFDEVGAMRGNPMDKMFNTFSGAAATFSTEADRNSFFKEFGMGKDVKPKKKDDTKVGDY